MKLDILRSLEEMTVALENIRQLVCGLPDDVPTASIVPQFGGQLRFWKPDKAQMAALFGSDGWKRKNCSWRTEFDYEKVLPCGVTVVLEKMEDRYEIRFPEDVDPALFEEAK